ncbi:MAG TPA: serine/threonine-protein kinase, partial [Gemmatimonadaceae bacterium]|nr:serine/threonine-protein kinase [Gemmatimonadaceae bacterium]
MTPPQGSANDPLIGTVIAERYRVTAQIGEGGMGRVYLAEHVRMGRRSALKVMSPALAATPDAITRFNREASNASRINHPNVAAVYDFGETDAGLLYIAMEFVEGETLSAIIQREGRLPVARAAAITKGVADALAAAHHLEIIHRDLKPDNIMIARQLDGSDWVKVVDFGIAKTVTQGGAGQTVTTIGVSLGTPEYMSPEQLAGEKLDARTDIYSLGLVLFHMLTGELPYPRLTSKETLVRRLVSAPATLGEVCPDVAWPPALQAALNRALAPDVADRYATVAEFGRDVVRAAQEADADPDRTLRVTSGARPAAVTPAAVPATRRAERVRTGPVGPGHTKAQPAEPRRSRAGLAALVVGLVAVTAAGGWYAMRGRAATTPAATSAMPADSTQAHAPDSTHTDTPDSTPAHTAESTKPQAPRSAPAAAPAGAGQVATLRDSVQRLQRAFARQADSLSRAEAASP